MLPRLLRALARRVRLGADPRSCPRGTLVILPRGPSVVLRCGIAALVEVAGAGGAACAASNGDAAEDVQAVLAAGLRVVCPEGAAPDEAGRAVYAGGDERLDRLAAWARGLVRSTAFPELVLDAEHRREVGELAASLRGFAAREDELLQAAAGSLSEADLELWSARLLRLRDIAWHVEQEALSSADDVRALCADDEPTPKLLVELRRVTAVLRSVNRIEIRGRDSAGLAVQVAFSAPEWFRAFLGLVERRGLAAEVGRRLGLPDLPSGAILMSEGEPRPDVRPTMTFVYKVAAEVGRLGDNVAALTAQIRADRLLRMALSTPESSVLVLGHTRWASSGVINVPNCHPVDNGACEDEAAEGPETVRGGRVLVVMNGDVDNHVELRAAYERESGRHVSPRITTDTKAVALEIERHLAAGAAPDEAFRRAVAAFEGSCAIGMITDLAPGRLFLSLRGSGQSLYVGLSGEGFFASSEVYGLVEETARYVKLDGESERRPGDPSSRGEIVVVGDSGPAGAAGVRRSGFDGGAAPVRAEDVRVAEITTRDVDRGDFDHFFRKEITQAARSVARTLWGRVTATADGRRRLAERILPERVRMQLEAGRVRQVFVVGQGTAGVAGAGIAEYLRRLLRASPLRVHALPATELSGFHLREDMADSLVVAVTQSGSTADTNRAVDLARRRGAYVMAVVNRRNSDITYRADGVVYTSDGRDVEMSVASTKAFYAQLVAGALLSLAIARAVGAMGASEVERELDELAALPALMERVLAGEDAIREAAERLAPTREHWAVVASGPNRVAGEEVRIKLSELCYKSIAVDTIENKKHIDLSSEPLVLVLAAGNPPPVMNDVVKDVAIFKAHKALPIVFAPEGEQRFAPYAAAVVTIPAAPPLSSVLLNALAGHLFGYHAARAVDENARFLSGVRAAVVAASLDEAQREALPATLAPQRREYLERLERGRFTSSLHPVTAVRLAMLFDLATGVSVGAPEDEALTGADGDSLLPFVNALSTALDQCARPIDAIKHQAKIVTVGTSRPEEALVGVFADALTAAGVEQESLAPVDLLHLRRVQPAVDAVLGSTRYEVSGLRGDGTPGPGSTIRVVDRRGVASGLKSRAEGGAPLAGTKRQVVADRRLWLGVGRGDQRQIAILPVLSADRRVAGLLLLHLRFVTDLPREEKARVLGPKLDRLRDVVAEANRAFEPGLLDRIPPAAAVLEDANELADRVVQP